MRFPNAFAFAGAVLLGTVCAQSNAILAVESQYPTCALKCMAEYIPQSSCAVTDFACICANEALNANITVCTLGSCTVTELLTTKNVSSTLCGVEVRDRTKEISYIGMGVGCFALLAYILRLVAIWLRKAWGWDDTIMTIVVLLAVPPTIFSVVLADNGLGKDIWNVPFDDVTRILHIYFLGENFYLAALALTKISILCFYLRVFPDQDYRRVLYLAMAFCAAYGISFVFATVFQCSPVSYAWTRWDGEHIGSCNNINLQSWLSAIFNIVLDIMTISLPLPKLYRLHMSWKKKGMLMLMFSLGFFVTLVSILRLQSLIEFATSQNFTWDYVPAAYWSTIEMHVGIVCACLPAHRFLLGTIRSKIVGSTKGASATISKSSETKGSKSVYQSPAKFDADSRSNFIPLDDIELSAAGSGIHRTPESSTHTVEK
ncbi:related to integral membrane protein PTH11 [Phialocephala subalpina]|uniref:Related to integral membrane protein PTH11 n=1 Tax=Phialocephala subalpina TaxID=576137 RepID=A0A1L7WPK6_9HELO|nr:related to integral membrane protein PTH11 [Phialocephala subalpina]